MKQFFLLASFLLVSTQPIFSQVQSEWRGIGRTGVYNETGLLKKWPKEGPKLLWHYDSLAFGYSSVAISYETIYVTGREDSTDVLIALKLDGTFKWQTPYGLAWNKSFPDSRSTPTIDGNKLYISSGLGDIACINAEDGEIIWSLKASKQFEGTFGFWGIAENLLIVDDKLIYTPGGKKTTMVALDKTTGKVIWQSESIGDKPAYVSPIIVNENNKKVIISVLSNYLITVDSKDGKILAKFDYAAIENKKSIAFWDGGPYTNTISPVYFKNSLYVTSGYDHVGVKFNLSDDFSSINLEWVDSTLDVHLGGAVLIDGNIFGSNWISNSKGNWCCINWETGKTNYETEWKSKGPIIANEGMLYCCDDKKGNIALVKANPEKFEPISSFKVPYGKGPYWSHPVINSGILYVRHGKALMAYSIKNN